MTVTRFKLLEDYLTLWRLIEKTLCVVIIIFHSSMEINNKRLTAQHLPIYFKTNTFDF